MSAPKIALAIPYAGWLPERQESMARLRYALGIVSDYDKHEPQSFVDSTSLPTAYREFGERLPNDQWSEAVFTWLASTNADWCAQIQEDAVVPDNFWPIVHAIIEATPKDIDVVGLHVVSPVAEALLTEGARLFTSADALVGVCWLVRGPAMREFVEWRRTQLNDGWRTPTPPQNLPAITEDTMMGVWALTTGRRILHTCPAVLDHDVSMTSVHGNDAHQNRRPRVRWDDPRATWTPQDLEDPAWWQGGTAIPHIGRHYSATPNLARRWVKSLTAADHARILGDDGSAFLNGLRYRMLARVYKEPEIKLFIGTPHRGSVHPEHMMSIVRLQRLLGLDVQHGLAIDPAEGGGGVRYEYDDLVRVRSRMLRLAYESGATHLMMSDSDNAFAPEVVAAMVKTGKDFVQCPYLRRDGRGYSIRALPHERATGPRNVQPDNTVEVEGLGLGLSIISRDCMTRMLTEYARKGLDFWDVVDGEPHLTTALFHTTIVDGELLSEDMAFTKRWRDVGGKVWMYVGPGSPIAHFGSTCFQGRIEDLGFERTGS